MDAIDKASTTLLLKEGEAFNNSVWGISRWGEKLGGHLPKAMGRGRKSQNEAAPCPGRAASCCRRGDLNHVIDVLISWSYDSPMALTPRLFREKQPLGLCCGLETNPWSPFTSVPSSAAPGGRGHLFGHHRGDYEVGRSLHLHYVAAAVDFATHASAVDLKQNLESKPWSYK